MYCSPWHAPYLGTSCIMTWELSSSSLLLLLQEFCDSLPLIILYKYKAIIVPPLNHSGFSSNKKCNRKTILSSQMLATLGKKVSYTSQSLCWQSLQNLLKNMFLPTSSCLRKRQTFLITEYKRNSPAFRLPQKKWHLNVWQYALYFFKFLGALTLEFYSLCLYLFPPPIFQELITGSNSRKFHLSNIHTRSALLLASNRKLTSFKYSRSEKNTR